MDIIRNGLLSSDALAVEQGARAVLSAKDSSSQSNVPTLDFSMFKLVRSIACELSQDTLRSLCAWVGDSALVQCVSFAALHGSIPLTKSLLPRLDEAGKVRLQPIIPILIQEEKWAILQEFLAIEVFPHSDESTVWCSLIDKAQKTDIFHLFGLMTGGRVTSEICTAVNQRRIQSYCRLMMTMENLDEREHTIAEYILNFFCE